MSEKKKAFEIVNSRPSTKEEYEKYSDRNKIALEKLSKQASEQILEGLVQSDKRKHK